MFNSAVPAVRKQLHFAHTPAHACHMLTWFVLAVKPSLSAARLRAHGR